MKHPFSQFSFCPVCGGKSFEVNNSKSKKCGSCGFVYYFNPSSSVVAFIFNANGELLVCRRANEPEKGTLDLPGGFTDMHETAEIAIRREIKEELNLEIDSLSYQFSLPNIYVYSGFEVHTLDLFFKCDVSSFDNMKVADDVSDAYFLSLNDINPKDFGLLSIRKAVEMLLKKHHLTNS